MTTYQKFSAPIFLFFRAEYSVWVWNLARTSRRDKKEKKNKEKKIRSGHLMTWTPNSHRIIQKDFFPPPLGPFYYLGQLFSKYVNFCLLIAFVKPQIIIIPTHRNRRMQHYLQICTSKPHMYKCTRFERGGCMSPFHRLTSGPLHHQLYSGSQNSGPWTMPF